MAIFTIHKNEFCFGFCIRALSMLRVRSKNQNKLTVNFIEFSRVYKMLGPEIDVGALSKLSSENFRVLLRQMPGTKDLMTKPHLISQLDKIAGMS